MIFYLENETTWLQCHYMINVSVKSAVKLVEILEIIIYQANLRFIYIFLWTQMRFSHIFRIGFFSCCKCLITANSKCIKKKFPDKQNLFFYLMNILIVFSVFSCCPQLTTTLIKHLIKQTPDFICALLFFHCISLMVHCFWAYLHFQ